MNTWLVVFRKELLDALRDRRTLLVILFSSIMSGPLMMILFSVLLSDLEAGRDTRVVMIQGAYYAPAIKNFFERQSYQVKEPPADFEQQLRDSKFDNPVLVIESSFSEKLIKGELPVVQLLLDSSNKRNESGASQIRQLLTAFAREQGGLELAARGVAPNAMQTFEVETSDLASPSSRAAQLTSFLPMIVMMAVVYGALNAAVDTCAGERERGSLEPLLMNPGSARSIVVGKWAAVCAISLLIAAMSTLSFFPAQWLIKSESLQAMFNFGPREGILFFAILIPMAGALSALLMAVAIRTKSFKEAMSNSTVVLIFVSLVPLVNVFASGGEKTWYYAIPALGQQMLMMRVLRADPISWIQILIPIVVAVIVAVLSLQFVAKSLKNAAVR
jgi:sodium transport system permease protein